MQEKNESSVILWWEENVLDGFSRLYIFCVARYIGNSAIWCSVHLLLGPRTDTMTVFCLCSCCVNKEYEPIVDDYDIKPVRANQHQEVNRKI